MDSVLPAALHEAYEHRSLAVTAAVLLVGGATRYIAPEEARRLRGARILLYLHLGLLPFAGAARATPESLYRELHFAARLTSALALITVCGSVLFAVVLPRLRVPTPRILREVSVAGASLAALFVLAARAGFSLSGLIATSTVVTAVIGLSFQDTLGNVMAGLVLQLDRSLAVGDWVKAGDQVGKVREVRWRFTTIETRNGETVVLPNSVLVRNPFALLGRREGQPLQWRRWIWFNVDFRYAPAEVLEAVQTALAGSIPNVSASPAPDCILMDLHESYARYAVRYWLTDLQVDDPTDSVVRTRVFYGLKRAGIPLSLPAHAVFLTEESRERKAEKLDTEMSRRLEALSRVDLFEKLSPEDHAFLAGNLRDAPFARGEVMTRQGAEAHWLYLIIEGEASVHVAEEGMTREVARLAAGDFFGEMGLMTGAPRSATVIAESPVRCYRLDRSAFQEIVRRRPEVAEHVAEILASRRSAVEAARAGLDAAAAENRRLARKADLLQSIRGFFGVA